MEPRSTIPRARERLGSIVDGSILGRTSRPTAPAGLDRPRDRQQRAPTCNIAGRTACGGSPRRDHHRSPVGAECRGGAVRGEVVLSRNPVLPSDVHIPDPEARHARRPPLRLRRLRRPRGHVLQRLPSRRIHSGPRRVDRPRRRVLREGRPVVPVERRPATRAVDHCVPAPFGHARLCPAAAPARGAQGGARRHPHVLSHQACASAAVRP